MMRHILLSLCIILMPLAYAGAQDAPVNTSRIVFLGDSITDGNTYPLLIEQGLREKGMAIPQLFNAGIGGDTSTGMLKRLDRDVLRRWPTLVTVSAGVNDSGDGNGLTAEAFRRNIDEIATHLQMGGAQVVLMTTSIVREPAKQKRLNEYNNMIRAMSKDRWLRLADVDAEMKKYPNAEAGLLTDDGIHPNFEGQRVIARAVLDALGYSQVAVPKKLVLSVMPGVIRQWKMRAAGKDEPELTESSASALTLESCPAALELPEKTGGDPAMWPEQERQRGFAMNLSGRAVPAERFVGVAEVQSDTDKTVTLAVGGPVRKVFINGKLALKPAQEGRAGWHAFKEDVNVELKKGINRIVIETGNSFFLSLTEPENLLAQAPVIPFTSVRPSIDGKMDESVWQHAAVLGPLIAPSNCEFDEPAAMPEYRTEVRMLWDADNLYALFICHGPQPKATYQKHDDPVYQEDVAELFVDLTGRHQAYGEFQTNAIGTTADYFHYWEISKTEPATREQQADAKWNAGGFIAAGGPLKKNGADKGWVVEIKLPVADLAVRSGVGGQLSAGQVLYLNALRYVRLPRTGMPDGELFRQLNWTQTARGCPHFTPETMRPVVLGTARSEGVASQAAPVADVKNNRVITLKNFSDQGLITGPRDIWIYLPQDYDKSKERYRVIYFHDGHELFYATKTDAPLDSTVQMDLVYDRLVTQGVIEPAILVGIDSGPNNGRELELTTSRDEHGRGGRIDDYYKFISTIVKPYVDQHYRTMPGPEFTGISGWSYGGLASFYMAYRHPEVFGMAGCFSSSLWWDKQKLLDEISRDELPKNKVKFWLSAGIEETEAMWQPGMRAINILMDKGWREGRDAGFYLDYTGKHDKLSWNRQAPQMLTFLLGKKAPELTGAALKWAHTSDECPIRMTDSAAYPYATVELQYDNGIRMNTPRAIVRSNSPDVVSVDTGRFNQLTSHGRGVALLSAEYENLRVSQFAFGYRSEDLPSHPMLPCPRISLKPDMSGSLKAWREIPFYPIADGTPEVNDAPARQFAAAYDEQFLYVVVIIKDQHVVASSDHAPWTQDGVEVRVNALPEPYRSGTPGDAENRFLLLAASPSGDRGSIFNAQRLPAGVEASCVRTAEGYVLNAAIPSAWVDKQQKTSWRDFALNVCVNNKDSADGTVTKTWWLPDWRTSQRRIDAGLFSR